MSNNKQSSVEYLMDKLFDPSSMVKEQLEWFEKAKEIHKEEHRRTYNQGLMSNFQNFKEYYNETYGGNK